MKFILSLIICILMSGAALAQDSNPRLRNFRYGTGQSSWWTTPQRKPQVSYYPPAVRYYYPVPYYNTHHPYCRCYTCLRQRPVMMWQFQMNPNRLFLFQFRF